MFYKLQRKFKNFVVTLRFAILSIFITFFILTLSLAVGVFYFHILDVTYSAGYLLMRETSYNVLDQLDLQLEPEKSASLFSARNIRQNVIDPKQENDIVPYLVHLLKGLPLAQGAYWASVDGSFIFARKLPNGNFSIENINRNVSPPTAVLLYTDDQHKVIRGQWIKPLFDPRADPWFKHVQKYKEPMWSDAYLYEYDEPFVGITILSPALLDDGTFLGVFGIDVTLENLSEYLWKLKISEHAETYIIDDKAQVIASSYVQSKLKRNQILKIDQLDEPWLVVAYNLYKQHKQELFHFDLNGIRYLASFKRIPILSKKGWMIVTINRSSDYTENLHKTEVFYFIAYFITTLLGILLMSKVITRVVRPIKKLVHETENVKNFHLRKSSKIDSHIKEVIELSESIESMKGGLRSFKRYVPAGLVRQLIRTGEGVQIGGSKKELAIFFSDITNFTTISESENSNELVKQVCDYFEGLANIILENRGTIDKYIGDSVMAFWGAPRHVKSPCLHAARAALLSIKQLAILNELWELEGKPLLHTRIGLHYGEMIVGNIGSKERINYTVVGDNVNTANRLVDVNKVYGTSILVSEPFYNRIHHKFVLRLVDHVTLKGKKTVTQLYELLAEDKSEIAFDVDAYRNVFSEGFKAYQNQQWKQAISFFEQCLQIYPKDKLAPVFIHRCQHFILHPPRKNWQGIWQLKSK